MEYLKTPVLFLIFNRPTHTRLVFEEIKKQKPKKLYIAADGPRHAKKEEVDLCNLTRKIVIDNIDWDCEVFTLFREENLGCGKGVSSAIDWFFDNEEEGMILEDDCLPNETFFYLCEEMLTRYRNNVEVMHIGTTNYQQGIIRGKYSYYFSRYAHIWGWATWRRAWAKYDFTLEKYAGLPTDGLNETQRIWLKDACAGKVDTWDFQWFFSVWFNKGICITPNVNLVKNIGYGIDATHTTRPPKWYKKMRYGAVNKILNPPEIKIDPIADNFTLSTVFCYSPVKQTIKKILAHFK